MDLEFGYGNTASEIANNIMSLVKLGVVGINIEDSIIVNGTRKLQDSILFAQLIQDVKNSLIHQNISIFINVRCDAFLLNIPNALKVASERIKDYEQAGADGIFLPCITHCITKHNIDKS